MFTSEGTITVTGHTDNVGSAAANQVLSEQRAQTVVNTLIGLAAAATGAPAESFQDTFIAEGRGSSQPVADNSTEAGKALNRRVTFQINRR